MGCASVLSLALLTGCGDNAESANENVQIDEVQVDESGAVEGEATESDTANDNQLTMMRVVSIDGNQITATVMKQNAGRGQKPDGEAPADQNGEMPQKPEGEAPAGQDGEMPQKPDGEAPKGDVSGNNPGRGEMETITFTITETTQITQESEDGNTDATADQITTDSMLQVELNENNEAVTIVIRTMPEAK